MWSAPGDCRAIRDPFTILHWQIAWSRVNRDNGADKRSPFIIYWFIAIFQPLMILIMHCALRWQLMDVWPRFCNLALTLERIKIHEDRYYKIPFYFILNTSHFTKFNQFNSSTNQPPAFYFHKWCWSVYFVEFHCWPDFQEVSEEFSALELCVLQVELICSTL